MKPVRIMQKPYHLVGTKDGQEVVRLTVFPSRFYGEAENIHKITDGSIDHMVKVVDVGNSTSWKINDKIKLTHPAGKFPHTEVDGVHYVMTLIPGIRAAKPRSTTKADVVKDATPKKRGRPAKVKPAEVAATDATAQPAAAVAQA